MHVRFLSDFQALFDRFFVHSFKTVCDSNDIYDGAALWLFQHFVKDPAKAALAHKVSTTKQGVPAWKRKLTTYGQVHNYLLVSYTIDDVTTVFTADVTSFKQLVEMSAARYSRLEWEKTVRCGPVYDESCLKAMFIRGF